MFSAGLVRRLGQYRGVDVSGDLDGGVTKHRLHGLQPGTSSQGHGHCAVAQPVDGDRRQPRGKHHTGKDAREPVPRLRPAVGEREHVTGFGPPLPRRRTFDLLPVAVRRSAVTVV